MSCNRKYIKVIVIIINQRINNNFTNDKIGIFCKKFRNRTL